jgi:hypothetical protein
LGGDWLFLLRRFVLVLGVLGRFVLCLHASLVGLLLLLTTGHSLLIELFGNVRWDLDWLDVVLGGRGVWREVVHDELFVKFGCWEIAIE